MSMKANPAGERHLSWGAAALGAALSLGGCSAVVSDLGDIAPDPEGCIQEPGLRGTTRDLELVFLQMEPHGSQKTVATLVRRGSEMIQARAIFLPTGAAALGPRRLVREERPESVDGLRCRLASGAQLDVLVRVPRALPPDIANSGPYRLDFWSDLNRSGGGVEMFPSDHSWTANVCDNGTLLFAHNTGFEPLGEAAAAGTFRAALNPDTVLPLLARGSPRFMGIPLADRPAFIDATAQRLRELPFVITIERQGIMVGYLRTELDCLVPAMDGSVALAVPGVVDGGNFHELQAYFDTQRNGRFDRACDPTCRATVEQTNPDGSLTYTISDSAACEFPDGFHQDAPGEDCAIIAAPTVEAFLRSDSVDAGVADAGPSS